MLIQTSVHIRSVVRVCIFSVLAAYGKHSAAVGRYIFLQHFDEVFGHIGVSDTVLDARAQIVVGNVVENNLVILTQFVNRRRNFLRIVHVEYGNVKIAFFGQKVDQSVRFSAVSFQNQNFVEYFQIEICIVDVVLNNSVLVGLRKLVNGKAHFVKSVSIKRMV